MIYIINALVCFLFAVLAHMAYCRIGKIKDIAINSFVLISLAFGCILAATNFFCIPRMAAADAHGLMGMPLYWSALLLYFALIPFYVSFYHSIIINSPTRLVLDLCQAPGGCTYAQLEKAINDDDFLQSRLSALIDHHVVVHNKGVYTLSLQGKTIGRGLDMYQCLVGRAKGG